MQCYTHNLSDNFTIFVSKTQQRFLSSYQKKSQFIAVIEQMRDRDTCKIIGVDYTHYLEVFGSGNRFQNFIKRLRDCGSYLTFRYYHKKDETKLHSANFCKADKLCPACAVRRAYKQQQKFLKAWNIEKDLQSKNWYYIVIPVKHSKDETIEDVYNRLDRVRKSILKAIRNKKSGRKVGFWGKFDGGMGSIEVTKTNNGWNVHLNLLVCSDEDIELEKITTKDKFGNCKINYINNQLIKHLQKVADGSFIHNISKIDTSNEDELKSNLVEVMKYSLKFSSLSTLDLVEVYMKFYRKRLFFTFGNLWGLKLDDVELEGDDIVDDEFIEIIYKRVYGGYEKVSEEYKRDEKKSNKDITKKRSVKKEYSKKEKSKKVEIIIQDKEGYIKERYFIYKNISDFDIFARSINKAPPPI